MCTVSLIRTTDRLRVACNRDEQRTRLPAIVPQVIERDHQSVVMPLDPIGGGTWIAATSRGRVFVILNVNPSNTTILPGRTSRGRVIPALVDAVDMQDVALRAGRLSLRSYSPFHLVVVDRSSGLSLRWDQQTFSVNVLQSDAMVFSSSGLGDGRVERPRAELFDEMVIHAPDRVGAQDAFHAHEWSDRPELSVLMERADARTVSRTVVDVDAAQLRMSYHMIGESQDQVVNLPVEQDAFRCG